MLKCSIDEGRTLLEVRFDEFPSCCGAYIAHEFQMYEFDFTKEEKAYVLNWIKTEFVKFQISIFAILPIVTDEELEDEEYED